MTTLQYQTLIFPPNLFYTLEEFEKFIKIREEGWYEGLLAVLKVCEKHELYEYCAIIKRELDSCE
jgi:hypothetical protein